MNGKTPYSVEMIMAFTGFSLWTFGDASIRFLKDYPTELVAFLSASVALSLLLLFSKRLGGLRETFTRPQLKLRAFRGAILACSGICAFFTFTHLDMTKAYAIIFAAPLLAKILSVFINKESIRLRSWAITMLGFLGVIIVMRPGFIPIGIGSIAALALAIFFSLGYVMARYIDDENQTLLSMAIFNYIFMVIFTAGPAYLAYQELELSFSFAQYFALFTIGTCAISGAVLVAKAFSVAPTQVIAPIHYVQILWGVMFSALLFHEMPDFWTFVGGGVITLSGLMLIRFSRPV